MTKTQKAIKYCAIVFAILLIVGIFSGVIELCAAIFSSFVKVDTDAVGEWRAHELSDWESVRKLNITVSAAAVEIKNGEAFSLESNHKYLKAQIKNGTLLIDEDVPFLRHRSEDVNVKVILTVPSGFSFERSEIETGAGKLTAEALCTEKLQMELGAGETVFENLIVTGEAEIDTGIGKFSVRDGSIGRLDLAIGVGHVSITANLLQKSEIDCGIGSAELCLLGEKDDYTVVVNKGFGSIKADGKAVSNGTKIGNGSIDLEINGGIGDIDIYFKNKEG